MRTGKPFGDGDHLAWVGWPHRVSCLFFGHRPLALSSRSGPRTGGRIFRLMCGRARLSSDVSEIKLVFSIQPHRPSPNFAPSGMEHPPARSRWSATTQGPVNAARK
jgi:hypothetical protein